MSDFSQHPPSINEIRAGRSRSAADWTARDALVSLLRGIDAGEIKPNALVVLVRSQDPKDESKVLLTWAVSSPDLYTTIGLIERGKAAIMTAD